MCKISNPSYLPGLLARFCIVGSCNCNRRGEECKKESDGSDMNLLFSVLRDDYPKNQLLLCTIVPLIKQSNYFMARKLNDALVIRDHSSGFKSSVQR